MNATGTGQAEGFIALPGTAQPHYDDATVIFRFKDLLLLAMFDISTSRPLPKGILLTTFKAAVDDAIARADLSTEPGALLNMLQCFVAQLNDKLQGGCASITVAFINTYRVWGYCAGDVRMGYVKEGSLNWLTPVHTAANVFAPFTDELKSSPNRHLLTRSLRPHRPFKPEYFKFDLSNDSQVVCATDGFWCDPLWGNTQSLMYIPSQQPIDDCTCLWFNAHTVLEKNVFMLAHEELQVFTQYDALNINSN